MPMALSTSKGSNLKSGVLLRKQSRGVPQLHWVGWLPRGEPYIGEVSSPGASQIVGL